MVRSSDPFQLTETKISKVITNRINKKNCLQSGEHHGKLSFYGTEEYSLSFDFFFMGKWQKSNNVMKDIKNPNLNQ